MSIMDEKHDSKQKKTALRVIRVGSRKSQLALIQTNLVIDALREYAKNKSNIACELNAQDTRIEREKLEYEIVEMSTKGDEILDRALPAIGAKSLFTDELESALLEHKVDFVVHSLKDMPTTLPNDLSICCITQRDERDDVLVIKQSLRNKLSPEEIFGGDSVGDYKQGKAKIRIGTSSQRRLAMLKRCSNQYLECLDIRGNLNTRFNKLDNQDNPEYSAIILAAAGLNRLGMSDRVSLKLDPRSTRECANFQFDWCYAVGQGAIAVECRSDNQFIKKLLSSIVDLDTVYEIIAERTLMKKLEGGCSIPLGVRTEWSEDNTAQMKLKGMVLSIDGARLYERGCSIDLDENQPSNDDDFTDIDLAESLLSNEVKRRLVNSSKLGRLVANELTEIGAKKLLDEIKNKRLK